MADFELDVQGIDSTLDAIKRDIHRGMEKSADALVENAKTVARRRISEEKAIFNAEVYKGFQSAETKNTPSAVRVKLYNDVEHAEVLEEGATFPAEGPPVTALLPWVARKMNWRPNDVSLGDAGIPDSLDDSDDDEGGGNGSTSHEDRHETEVASEDSLEEDTTDDGLTLRTQAADLSTSSGDLEGVDHELSQEVLFGVSDYQREYSMPRVESLFAGDYDTIEAAFTDTNTITLPHNQFEYDEFLDVRQSTYISEKNETDRYFNTNDTSHVQYVIDHQYGRYVYENLSQTGLDEFRERWGFTQTESGWELPDDADETSLYAAQGEEEFFAEVFAGHIDEGFRPSERFKTEYYEKIRNLDADYFNDTFLEKPTDTVSYRIGYDYSGDREIVKQSDLSEYGDETFTTNFNPRIYIDGSALYDRSSYVITAPNMEGARAVTYRDGKFTDPETDITYSVDEATIQAIPRREQVYNSLDRHEEVVVEEYDDFMNFTGDYHSVYLRHAADRPWEQEVVEGQEVFTGEYIEINRDSIVGYRADHPDKWAQGVDTVDTVQLSEIEDGFTGSYPDSEITEADVRRSLWEIDHIIVQDNDGDYYRAIESDTTGATFESKYPTEDGEKLEWSYDYDDKSANGISISQIHERPVKFNNIEDGENIIVDPDSMRGSGYWTDDVYRATVDKSSITGTVMAKPFGVATDNREKVSYHAFVDTREDVPGWDSKNWDKGRRVTVDNGIRQATGHLEKTESSDSDAKSYEVNRMRLVTDEGKSVSFTALDVISSKDDGFMEQWTDAPDHMDHTGSLWNDYGGEVTRDMLRPRDYHPLEGKDDLHEGQGFTYEISGNSYTSTVDHVRDLSSDETVYISEAGHDVTPEDITRFDGQGADPESLEVGGDVSTGSSFGTITRLSTDDDGTATGAYVDFTGDGEYDDLLSAYELRTVDVEFPNDTKIMFWSHRDGEMKTGEVRFMIAGQLYVRGSDSRIDYKESSSALYPMTPMAYQLPTDDG